MIEVEQKKKIWKKMLVAQCRSHHQVAVINVQSMTSGQYLLRVLQNEKQVATKKLVVTHPE